MHKPLLLICILFLTSCDLFHKEVHVVIPQGAVTKKSIGYKKIEHIFILDQSMPVLGEAWKDETAMIWGDIIRNADNSIRYFNHKEAILYCEKLGAKLPSEEDFSRLREYMGAKPDLYEGYTPQVLPNLFRKNGDKILSNFFWASNNDWFHYHLAYVFGGKLGGFAMANELFDDDFTSARCVVQK